MRNTQRLHNTAHHHACKSRQYEMVKLRSQGWRTFATVETPAIQDAEINPLLQTPAPVSRDTFEKLRPASRMPSRGRDPATAKAVLRDIPISAKKLAMWTDVVRRKHIDDAIVQCEMAHKKAAKICLKVRDKFAFHKRYADRSSWPNAPSLCKSSEIEQLYTPRPDKGGECKGKRTGLYMPHSRWRLCYVNVTVPC